MKSGLNFLFILIITGLCVISYSRTFDVPFIFDDVSCIERNPFILHIRNYISRQALDETFAAWPGVPEDIRNSFITRPLPYLTFSLNYYIHGYTLTGYHLVNTFIHIVNAFLVFMLVQASVHLLIRKKALDQENIPSQWILHSAFLTAAIFAVHPLMTSAVTYIVQRMTSLLALFYLASVLMYAHHAASRIKAKKYAWYALSFVFCSAAMLTKESAITLPLTLLLYELVFCSGEISKRVTRLIPFLLTMAVVPYNVISLQNSETATSGGSMSSSLNLINFQHVSSWEYLLTQCRAVAFYVKLLLLPFGLSLEHDFPVSHTPADIWVIVSFGLHLLLLGYGGFLIVRTQQSPAVAILDKLSGCGIVWFYVTLAVESSVIPMNEMVVEYRTYLPSIGIFLFMVCRVQRFLGGENSETVRWRDFFLWVPILCILLYLTIARNEVWRKPELFWTQTVSQYPKLSRPYANLAGYYVSRGELAKAVTVYTSAIQQMPNKAILYFDLGVVHMRSRDYESAVFALVRALSLDPGMLQAYELLIQAYIFMGQHGLASGISTALEAVRNGT
jgi:hypothetical protein